MGAWRKDGGEEEDGKSCRNEFKSGIRIAFFIMAQEREEKQCE
jgi:hypothetical protein